LAFATAALRWWRFAFLSRFWSLETCFLALTTWACWLEHEVALEAALAEPAS